MSVAKTILVVEDEGIVALDLKRSLEEFGYNVFTAASGDQAVHLASEIAPSLALMDIRIQGDKDGIETATILHQRFGIPIIFLTAHADNETIQRAKLTEPYGYLTKPVKVNELRSVVEIGLYKYDVEHQRLREHDRWFTAMLNSVLDGVISVDTQGLVAYMNPGAEKFTGVKFEEALGRPVNDILSLTPDTAQRVATIAWKRAVHAGTASEQHEAELRNATDGSTRMIVYSVAPVIDDSGSKPGAVMAFAVMALHDVTILKTLQRQLETTNRELEAFSYSVSHDLSAPLRAIDGFSKTVIEDYADKLDDQGRDYLRRVSAATQHMGTLINDLLNLSKIARAPGSQPSQLNRSCATHFGKPRRERARPQS